MLNTSKPQRLQAIDSHTAGEPTRVVISGAPHLGSGPLSDRLEHFRNHYDDFRSAIVNEPRGSDVLVGALLCEPHDIRCSIGVIFFNNVGYLGMCGHGTIGVVATLAYLKQIQPGELWIDTPVGPVQATLHPSGGVTIKNVRSYRAAARVPVQVPGYGTITGDIAWGGNWFFLVQDHQQQLTLNNVETLTDFTWAIRQALEAQNVRGDNGAVIDHIELFAPPTSPRADSRNFVLCPGKAYDRSPCGTGTSAKMACLHADGKLQPGQLWRQQGILGTIFQGSIEVRDDGIYPTITGHAFVTAETTLILGPSDPFVNGIRP